MGANQSSEEVTTLTARSFGCLNSQSIFYMFSLSPSISIIALSINVGMVSKVDMLKLKSNHAHNMFLRAFRVYSFRRAPSHRFHSPFSRRSKRATSFAMRSQGVLLSHRSMSRPTNKHAMRARATCAPSMPITDSEPKGPSSQSPHHTKEPKAMRHHSQFLGDLLKSVIIAMGILSCIGSILALGETRLGVRVIRIARKRPCFLKIIRAVRRRRHKFRIIRGPHAFTLFAVFIIWDVQNLAHDEPIEGKDKKTICDDPVAALSNARKELARMMNEERSRGR